MGLAMRALSVVVPGRQDRTCVRGVLLYCADHHCSHSIAVSGDRRADDLRLSDIEPRFTCTACGKRGADIRPDFNWKRKPVAMLGYR